MENTWTMEDAKNDFTAIAKAAYGGKPQYVTSHSHPDLVITTKNRDENLKNSSFKELLFSIPKGEPFIDENGRDELQLRDVEF